jgi:HPt (histidine-containing phosphotransfer) domain-containing protein
MDCLMPEMDGYEATRCIRKGLEGTRNPHIPIVALTADAMSGDHDRCLKAGMSDYIAKPVEPRQLAEILQKWLRPLPTAGTLEPPASTPSTASDFACAQPVFIQQDFLARLMGDKVLARKLVAGFIADVPRQLLALKLSLERGDAETAERQAHTLKGAAATMSAESLRALCSLAQEAVKSKQLGRALALLPRLEEQLKLLKTALDQWGWL